MITVPFIPAQVCGRGDGTENTTYLMTCMYFQEK